MGKFIIKTEEELKALDVNELALYYNEKNTADRLELDALIADKATKEDIQSLKDAITLNVEKQMESMNGLIKNQGVMITKLSKSDKKEEVIGLTATLKANKESFQAIKDRKETGIEIKVVGDMLESTNITGDVPQAQRLEGLNVIATRQTVIADLINRGVATSNVIDWVEQQNKEGVAGGTAEGVLKNQIDYDLVVVSEDLKKRTAYIKASEEILEDVPRMEFEIRNELLREHNLDLDDQILNGDNLGSNLNGIITQSTAFSAVGFANLIPGANYWDVLKVSINQVIVANFIPTSIVMHPTDITNMNLAKGSDGHYVLPPFTSAEGLQVSGLRVTPSTGIAIDNFLVMDGSRATTWWKNERRIEVGRDGNDFIKNMVTILIESRLLLVIKGNDTGAFVTGDFTTAVAAILKP
ncbi:MAG: phage major capsid protein [Aureibaculum sp.]|nr:phage major capsid protein [Aureibaculum sp.]